MWKDDEGRNSGFSDRSGDPSAFKREMGAFQNKFLGFDQHDSHEFLLFALDGIHNEMNRRDPPSEKKKSREINNNSSDADEENQVGLQNALKFHVLKGLCREHKQIELFLFKI